MSAELEDFFTVADVNLTLDLRLDIREVTSHRIRKYGYGDGYEVIAADGINSRMTEYAVTTEPIRAGGTQTQFQNRLDKVCKGDYFLTTLTPFSTEQRRYRLKDSTYERRIMPASGAMEFSFTLIEAHAYA